MWRQVWWRSFRGKQHIAWHVVGVQVALSACCLALHFEGTSLNPWNAMLGAAPFGFIMGYALSSPGRRRKRSLWRAFREAHQTAWHVVAAQFVLVTGYALLTRGALPLEIPIYPLVFALLVAMCAGSFFRSRRRGHRPRPRGRGSRKPVPTQTDNVRPIRPRPASRRMVPLASALAKAA